MKREMEALLQRIQELEDLLKKASPYVKLIRPSIYQEINEVLQRGRYGSAEYLEMIQRQESE